MKSYWGQDQGKTREAFSLSENLRGAKTILVMTRDEDDGGGDDDDNDDGWSGFC